MKRFVGAIVLCALFGVLVAQDINRPGPPPAPLPAGSKPVTLPSGLKDRTMIAAMAGPRMPKEVINLYYFSWKGDYKDYISKIAKSYPTKEGWKVVMSQPAMCAVERKIAKGKVFRQVLAIQNRRVILMDTKPATVKYSPDKGWITVVLNESVKP